MPVRSAEIGLFVIFSSAVFSVPEEFSFRESPIRRIPYRNIARPPSRDSTSNILMIASMFHSRLPAVTFRDYLLMS